MHVYHSFNGHLLFTSSLSARQRELLILRVAALRDAAYEWEQHVALAEEAGIDGDEIARIADGPDASGWSTEDAAMLRAVDQLIGDAMIDDATWAELSQTMDEHQLMDLVFTVGVYELLAMAFRSFGVQLDEDLRPALSSDEVPAEAPAATVTRRELAVARALDQARSRAETRVQLFLDAALELMNSNAGEFTVQEVAERSGQSLRTFYQYFAGKHELLLALFEDSIRVASQHLEDVIAEGEGPLDRLHRFAVEYFLMCRPNPKDQPPRPSTAMVEFAERLLTSHPKEAARAFAPLVAQLEELFAAAAASGEVRQGLDHRRISGVVLQATMFNVFATSISGPSSELDGDTEPEVLWDLLLRGIGATA